MADRHTDTRQWGGKVTNRKQRRPCGWLLSAVTGAALLLGSCAALAGGQVFETNVTHDLNLSSGEPEIAVDPRNPRHLAIIEFAVGSAEKPASTFNFNDYPEYAHDLAGALGNSSRVDISTDGGNKWSVTTLAVFFVAHGQRYGGGDPYIAYGPHGEIYAGGEIGAPPRSGSGTGQAAESTSGVAIAVSVDGGRTFSPQQSAGTPIDRPWLTVDESTGTLYSVSSGPYNVHTGQHNVRGPDAPNDRWLVAWKPRLAGKSRPRRLGGPDFSASAGSTIAAAHGVVAATFVLGGPRPGGGFFGRAVGPTPLPASLRGITPASVTSCSMQQPCLYFETSTDEGRHWTRHYISTPGGFNPHRANVSADPGRVGRFAVAVLNPQSSGFLVFVTDDDGRTWSGPATVPESAQGADFKQWMAYGPTGVLGLVWKKQRNDFGPAPQQPPHAPREVVGPGFDVYSAISCDGGLTWLAPVRVNSVTSPPGPAGSDDLAYIALGPHDADMVWGDRRHLHDVHNAGYAAGGLQAYFARVPFSVFSHGAVCGRH